MDPIMDSTTATIINFLFENLNFFKIPIKTNAIPANARISTQNSNNPPFIVNGVGSIPRNSARK